MTERRQLQQKLERKHSLNELQKLSVMSGKKLMTRTHVVSGNLIAFRREPVVGLSIAISKIDHSLDTRSFLCPSFPLLLSGRNRLIFHH